MNPAEPTPAAEPPQAPAWLSKRAHELFGVLTARIQGLGLASSSDTEKVMLAALRLEEIELRTADIERDGAVFVKVELAEGRDAEGKPVFREQRTLKPNPAVAQRSEAMRHLQSLLSDFGLCPSSRGKVSVFMGSGPAGAKNPWASLVGS